MEIAREIVCLLGIGEREAIGSHNFRITPDAQLVAAIAAAIEKDRAETIERCARVAELSAAEWRPVRIEDDLDRSAAARSRTSEAIAYRIRSLSTPPRAEEP